MPVTEEPLLTLIIQSIELREIRLPLINFFETSLVAPRNGASCWPVSPTRRARGLGECTAGEEPFYSNEWTETAWTTLQEFLAPMVLGKEVAERSEGFSP